MTDIGENLPEKHYERSMNHNYLVFSTYLFFGDGKEEDYTTKMLIGNQIQGLIPVVCRIQDAKKQYCYEINSLQSLDRLYEKQEIGFEVLHKLLFGCIHLFERLEEYLIDGGKILLQPEYIYLHMDTKEPHFICYPEYQGDVRLSFQKLMDYLLTKIDHTQEQAVWLAYQGYRYTRNTNYVLSELKEMLYEAKEKNKSVTTCLQTVQEDFAEEIAVPYFDSKSEADYEESILIKEETTQDSPRKKNIWGVLFCVLLLLSAVGVLLGSKLLPILSLSDKQKISLYGVMGMSVTAAVLFLVSILKKWKQEPQTQETEEEEEREYEGRVEPEIRFWQQDININKAKPAVSVARPSTEPLSNATTLLNQEVIREKCLQGMIHGKEVTFLLSQFPLTLGKSAAFADIVIPDNTVSRMHARLEERNGQIYLSDLNSTNGTQKNGEMLQIHEEVVLTLGDKITLGGVCLTYCEKSN